jgi:hypothetical protein|tara:strand:+ start:86 stop:778 length:693 start_codon:yes stop_codon:yes gene_type:complete
MSSIDQLKSLASSKLGFARSNQFLVELPTTFSGTTGFLGQLTTLLTSGVGLGSGGGDLNILCAAATLPGKQILSTERRIGMEFQKVAYGYAVDDVTLSFYLLNDYGTRKYFDEWRKQTLNEAGGIANYKKDYAKDVKIHQLRKPIKNIGIGSGPIRVNIGLGTGSVYSVRLIDAYPTTIQAIELTNDLDGLVQATVQLSYTNWERVSSGQGWISASAGITGGLGDLTSFL